jgi:hypothetical protein
MATFIWDPAVQWPPPANILLNYDVVANGDVIPALGSTRGVREMAAVLVQIRGTLYDVIKRTSQQVLLQGEASLMNIGVGGGPIIPPEGGSGGDGDHIWGPTDPRPTNPISGIPGLPGYEPPGTGTWPPQRPPHPAHPIVTPPPGGGIEGPPDGGAPPPDGMDKPPPADGGWGYWADPAVNSWVYKPGPTEAQPKS